MSCMVRPSTCSSMRANALLSAEAGRGTRISAGRSAVPLLLTTYSPRAPVSDPLPSQSCSWVKIALSVGSRELSNICGGRVPMRSVAWRLTFRHPERTLREKEIAGRRDKVLKTLDGELGVRQRTS